MIPTRRNRYVDRVRAATDTLLEALLESNRRLCLAIAVLSENRKPHTCDLEELGRRTESWQVERERLFELLEAAARESKGFEEQVATVQRQNSDLAALYAAVSAIHSSLDANAILSGIQEIVINLIGSEQFAVVRADEALTPMLLFGVSEAQIRELSPHTGLIRLASVEARAMVWPFGMSVDASGVRVCIPLVVNDTPHAFVLIFGFLAQKSEITSLDYELFAVVGNQAAVALYAAELAAARAAR